MYIQSTQSISAPATGATAGTALAANSARVYFQIQNTGANPLYVALGGTAASSSYYNFILQSGSSALDGKGGIYQSNVACYTGPVQVGGTAASYVAFEIAP